MLPNEYQKLAIRSQADQAVILHRLSCLGPKAMQADNAYRGLCNDIGELGDPIKKWIEYGQELNIFGKGGIKEETGDVLWRLAQLLDAVGLTLEECMEANIQKLKIRYPDGYSDFNAAEENRDRDKEQTAYAESVVPAMKHDYHPSVTICRGPGPEPEKRYQTGQGFAEPPQEYCLNSVHISADQIDETTTALVEISPEEVSEVVILKEIPPILTAHFGDGLVREPRDSSYSGFCGGCNRPIHHTNSSGLCPDCKADQLGGRLLHNERKSDAQS